MTEHGSHTPLIRTKLHRPPVPPDYVPRPRLHAPLASVSSRSLTLVSAAAGYGKSTLVSGWLDELEERSAWVSLDESDNDPREFLSYVVAAVQEVVPSALAETEALLGAASLPPVPVLTNTLVNELDELQEPLVFVLDDIHCIHDKSVLAVLSELLTHPPEEFHLVLVGRRDPFLPIARLRAQGQMEEVRVQGLSFTPEETASFLEKALDTEVEAELAEAWAEGSEGWVAGLRLAALALRGGGRVPQDPFGPLKIRRHAMEYLTLEVLEQQEPWVRDHLLRSSVADRFCGHLCDALAEVSVDRSGTGEDGQAFVSFLEERGLFVIPLDAESRRFRYHHLFRDLLRAEAQRRYGVDAIAVLHRLASDWFEGEGFVSEALMHALAVPDVERAADLVEKNWRPMVGGGKWYVVVKWLSQLPESVVQDRPELLLAECWRHYYRLEASDVEPVLDRIDGLLKDEGERTDLRGEVEGFRSFFHLLQGDGARSLEYAETALDRIAVTDERRRAGRAIGELILGLAGQMEGQGERVARALTTWLEDPSALHPVRETNLLQTLMFMEYISGHPAEALPYLQRAREISRSADLKNLAAWNDYMEGLCLLARAELDPAIRLLEETAGQKYFHHARGAVDALAALAVAYQARGQPERAAATLHALAEFAGSLGSLLQDVADSAVARVDLMQGRSDVAARWVATGASLPTDAMLWWFEIQGVTRCRTLIAEGSAAALKEAEEALRGYAAVNESQHNTCQLIAVLALLAVASEKRGRAEEGQAALRRALALAWEGGIIFPFLELGAPMADLLRRRLADTAHPDFVKRILTAHYELGMVPAAREPRDARTRLPASGTGNLLTSRELEVLELLAQGLYQREIAERLFVSPETVKTHLKHVYGKLGVGDRRRAVAAARALNLIDQS